MHLVGMRSWCGIDRFKEAARPEVLRIQALCLEGLECDSGIGAQFLNAIEGSSHIPANLLEAKSRYAR